MLYATQADEFDAITRLHGRQDALVLVVGRVVAALDVHGHVAGLNERRAVCAQQMPARAVGAGEQVDGHRVLDRMDHLAGDGALPDKRIEFLQVRVDAPFEHLRQHGGRGGADRLVRFLRVARFVLVHARRIGHGFRAIQLADHLANFTDGFVGKIDRIGTHVGDETDGALAVVDTFIKLLRESHGALRRVAELARRFLLQRRGGEGRRRVAVTLLALDVEHGERAGRHKPPRAFAIGLCHSGAGTARRPQCRLDGIGTGRVGEAELLDLASGELDETERKGLSAAFADGIERPVFARYKRLNFRLALADHT